MAANQPPPLPPWADWGSGQDFSLQSLLKQEREPQPGQPLPDDTTIFNVQMDAVGRFQHSIGTVVRVGTSGLATCTAIVIVSTDPHQVPPVAVVAHASSVDPAGIAQDAIQEAFQNNNAALNVRQPRIYIFHAKKRTTGLPTDPDAVAAIQAQFARSGNRVSTLQYLEPIDVPGRNYPGAAVWVMPRAPGEAPWVYLRNVPIDHTAPG